MSTASEPTTAPTVRRLERWGIPLHYVVPSAIGVLGVLLLLLGGGPAAFGGWWLATALPIAIGGFLRDRRFALVPVVLWIAWLAVGWIAGPDAALANTPVPVAIFLAAIGGGATLVAQTAIFPATAPEVWEAHGISLPSGEPTADEPTGAHDTLAAAAIDDDEHLDPALETVFEDDAVDEPAADEALEPAADAVDEIASAPNGADPRDEPRGPDELEASDESDDPSQSDEPDEADEPGEPTVAAEVVNAELLKLTAAEPEPDAAATPEPEPEPEPEHPKPGRAPTIEPRSLPLGVDPSPLDEGGHVTEFPALSEADLSS